jgi:hypothetical protein
MELSKQLVSLTNFLPDENIVALILVLKQPEREFNQVFPLRATNNSCRFIPMPPNIFVGP